MSRDIEHLQLLSTFHYVNAGLTALAACIPIIHVAMGLAMVFTPEAFGDGGAPPPAFVGWMLAAVGGLAMAIGWAFAALQLVVARALRRTRSYWLCLVVAGLNCMSFPIGTALGVATFLVLLRDSVKALFTGEPSLGYPYRARAEVA